MRHTTEPEKRVPVARDVDVVVAGGGVSGIFAALGAAKQGASVVLVDRFGTLGGNMGPGYFIGSVLYNEPGRTLHLIEYPGIPRQFVDRLERMLVETGIPRHYPSITHAISRLALQMLQEAGVTLMLSAYASDPITEDGVVRGIYVETKSGRVAVRAKVVIDSTGQAEVATRAGAPIRRSVPAKELDSPIIRPLCKDPAFSNWNESGVYFVIGDADFPKFTAFIGQEVKLSEADTQFAKDVLSWPPTGWKPPMTPLLRAAWESGEFRVRHQLSEQCWAYVPGWFEQVGEHLAAGRAIVSGDYQIGDWEDLSLIESAVRALTFDATVFLRRRVPGFERSFIVSISPFLGSRGGPCIEGEYTLRPQELWEGMDADDTLFRSYVGVLNKGTTAGCDMPYRMLLPQGVEGMLVTGRGMSYLRRGHDPGVRARCNMMMLGQAAGMAAAMAAADGVGPHKLDVKKLQRGLIAEGYLLGNEERLRQLGLQSASSA